MRISDWSSDVCSSDLQDRGRHDRDHHCVLDRHKAAKGPPGQRLHAGSRAGARIEGLELDKGKARVLAAAGEVEATHRHHRRDVLRLVLQQVVAHLGQHRLRALHAGIGRQLHLDERSEEHTSELQSLMRISYAVFCLKKKKKTKSIYTSS